MGVKLFLLLVSCVSTCIHLSNGTPDNPLVMKEITLSEVTPQGVLHLPPRQSEMEKDYLCDYWISFFKDIPEDVLEHHKDFGISITPLNFDLESQEDSIVLTAHPLDGDNSTSTTKFENATWNSASETLEFNSTFRDVCVNLNGSWKSSKASLLVTLYFDNTNMDDGNCPGGMTKCQCTSATTRCISQDLMCNGVENCGSNCDYDENVQAACAKENSYVMQEVSLTEIMPQGIIDLPPSHSKMEESHLCHYWLSFLQEIPSNVWEHHKDFGISVVPLNFELNSEDSILLMGHPVDSNISTPTFEKVTWNASSNSSPQSLEFSTLFQDVCINLKGNWEKSKAKLLVTLYYNNSDMSAENCPNGMTRCNCNTQNRRCISENLICNGVGNCGLGCRYDEGVHRSCAKSSYIETYIWASYEYLLMMFMIGLLLILIPVVFLMIMIYHRRMVGRMTSPVPFDGNNNVNRCNGQYPHVITMAPANDVPPMYDDLPEQMKVPLPPSAETQQRP